MSKRSYNFKYYPTKLLKEIIDSAPYYQCNNGHDYGPYKDEIEAEYQERINKRIDEYENKHKESK